jgi:hypothetical protein
MIRNLLRAFCSRLVDALLGPETEVPHYENWDESWM